MAGSKQGDIKIESGRGVRERNPGVLALALGFGGRSRRESQDVRLGRFGVFLVGVQGLSVLLEQNQQTPLYP